MSKKLEVLDANQRIGFEKVYEAINAVIGTNYSVWTQECWPNSIGNKHFRLWFLKLEETRKGNPVSANFGRVNTISDDWNQVTFDKKKERQVICGEKYTGFDLIFAKEPNGGPYIFRGVFIRDNENSRLNHKVSKRVATKVKLIGNPVYDIELLDSVENTTVSMPSSLEIDKISSSVTQKKKSAIVMPKMTKVKTPEGKLKNRIYKEFQKKILLGDIQINDEEFDILMDYFTKKYENMRISGQHVILDPVFCIALIQIGIRYYDSAFWNHVKKLIDDPHFNVNHQVWIGTSFSKTLKHYDKLQVSESNRVDSMLMHSFVSDFYAEKFFNFLYAFYKIDLDRDISRLDRETMNELISIIEKNDKSKRTNFLVEHTADAVRKNKRGAKTRIRRYLKLIDKAFWGDALPTSSGNRLMQRFLDWKDNAAEFVSEKSQHEGTGKRGKKSYTSPYLKYEGNQDRFKLVLPAQIIRFDDFFNLYWRIEFERFSKKLEINPYAQGVTGYKTEQVELWIKKEALFDVFSIELMNGDERIRAFRIPKEPIRFFDDDGDFIRNDSLSQGVAYSFTLSGFRPESEAIVDEFDNGILLRTTYEFVNGDIISIPDGKPLTVGGKLNEGILPRGIVSGVIAGESKDNISVYREIPSIFVKMLPQRTIGTALKVNDDIYHFSSENGLHDGISEFELLDRSGENGYLVDLRKFGCKQDGEYEVFIDVPNDRTTRIWKFVLISNLEYEFEEAPYIFKARGTLSFPKNSLFKEKNDIQVEVLDRKRFNFDIVPGDGRLYLDYKGINIGFEIPTISYKFHGEDWHTGHHIDIWHSDFDPRLLVTYNADKIKFFLDDKAEDRDDEYTETFVKNKSKGIFECDLNRFKSWFGREKVFRQIYIELPGLADPVPFVRVVTQSVFKAGVLRADFKHHRLLGNFEIIGYSDYYVDIEFAGKLVAEKVHLQDKYLEMESELKTGIYKITVYESEKDEYGFGDVIYYDIGTVKTELLNPADLSGKSVALTRIYPLNDDSSFLPLKYDYTVVDLTATEDNNIYTGKMIVGGRRCKVIATFPVMIEFYDLDHLQKSYITFLDEKDGVEFLYDEYKKSIVKEEDKSITKSQAYRRYKFSLYPDDYVFEVKFIERPVNADVDVNDEAYNNLRKVDRMKSLLSTSIFRK